MPSQTSAATGINSTVNFQGRLLSATGAVVADGNYNMEFRIYQDGAGTAAFNGGTYASPTGLDWSEDWLDSNSQGVVVKNGYFSVNLGSLCPLAGGACTGSQAFTNTGVSWNDPTLWLSMDVAGTGEATASCGATQALFHQTYNGTNGCSADGEMLPMRAMASSVYAESANGVTSANGLLTATQLVQLAEPIQTASTSTNPAIGINVTSGSGNIVELQSSGTDVFDVTGTGNILFGNGAAHTVSIAQSAAAGTGQALTVSGGQGGTGTGATGGLLTLQGGAGGGTTGGGGGVTIDAGAVTGSGTAGTISVGTTNAGTINLGNATSGTTTSLKSGTGGLTVSATAGNLTVQTVTSGTLAVTSAGILNLTGAANSTWSVGAGNTLAITSSNFTVTSAGVLNVTSGYQIGGAAANGNYLRGNGTSFVASTIQPGDIPVCTGTCHYISNQTGQQTTANFNIQSAASTSVGGVIQGATSQTADLFDLSDSTGALLDRFDASGDLEKIGYLDNGYGGIGSYSNLLTFSEQLNNAAWVPTGTLTVNANNTVAPDGNTTATQFVGTGSTNVIQTYTTTTATTYTFSVWLKQSSGATSTGLCIFSTAGTPSSCTATAVTPSSNNWQRFSVTQAITGSPTAVKVEILPGNTATATIWAWGADLTASTTPGVYVRTTTSNIAASSGVVSNGGVFISAISATDVPLVVQAAPAQSGNLLAIQGSNASALFTINSAGTVTVGAWQGTAVAAANGGTGQTTYAVGDLLYASTTSALSKLSDVATGDCLTSGGVGAAPAWNSCGSGAFLIQVPTANTGAGSNDIQPTASGINGLTVNGTSNATGATALIVAQAGTSGGIDAADINVTNASGTVGSGLAITKTGAGTLTDGLLFSGTIGTTIATAGAAAPAAITIQPGTATGGAGAAASLTGGTASSGAGGTATIQGGAAAAAAGSTGGGVNINGAAGSSTTTGGAGGGVSITAGNAGGSGANAGGNITLQGGSATSTGTAGGVIVKDATNNASAFQVQNASSEPVFDVDTTNSNLISNPGFEVNTTGWATDGAGTGLAIAQNTTLADTYEDRASLQVTTASGTASTGTSVTTALVPGAYTLTFYAMAQTTNFSTLNVTTTGGGTPACLTAQTVVTTGFTRYTCSFTGTTTNITAINFIVSDTTQHIFWLDGVQVVSGSNVTPYSLGNILLRGAVQNPAVFESSSNSNTAFQILNSSNNQIENISSIAVTNARGTVTYDAYFQVQDSSGNNILQVDPGNDRVDIGAGSAATDTTGDLLILDNQAVGSSTDPTEVDGSMYYNVALGAFRCGVGGAWQYCVNGPVGEVNTVPGPAATSQAIGTAAHIWVAPVYIPGPMTVNDFYIDVTVGLTTAGDVGLYNSAGTLVLDGGSSSLVITTTGLKTIAPTQTGTARNLPGGQYYAAWTSNGATGSVASTSMPVTGMYKSTGTLSSGGGLVLPGTITISSIAAGATYTDIGLSN